MTGLALDLCLELEQNLVVKIKHSHIHFNGLRDQGILEAFSDVNSVGSITDAFGEWLIVVLGVGVLDMFQKLRLLMHEVLSPPE